MRELVVIVAVLILLGGCAARESDDIVKLRLTQEFAKDERTFHECADWARESLGEDASAAEQMELTNSCLHMQSDLKDRVADIKEKEEELEAAKRELEEARRNIEDAKRKRESEREQELEETQQELEAERRKREAERQRELESARQRELDAARQKAAPRTSEEEMEAARQALEEAKKRELAAAREDLESARKEREKAKRELEAAKQERESNAPRANLTPDLAGGEDDLSALWDEWTTLIDLKESAKALRLGKKILRLVEQQEADARIASTLHNLGLVHYQLENYTNAERLLRRALNMFKAQKDHEGVKQARGNVSLVCNAQGAEYANKGIHSSAEKFFLCAVEEATAGLGAAHPTTMAHRKNLLTLYRKMGQHGKTLDVCNDLINVDSNAFLECAGGTIIPYNLKGTKPEEKP